MPQLPQSSLAGADAATTVPQQAQAPAQLNPYKTGNQMQQLEQGGMPTAQAVAKSAQNPVNRYAKGGKVADPTLDVIKTPQKIDPKMLSSATDAIRDEKALKNQPAGLSQELNPEAFSDPLSAQDKEMLGMFDDTLQGIKDGTVHKAKGGDIHETIKKMPLEAIIKLLASHPEVGAGLPTQGKGMATGGAVTKPANMKSGARAHGAGLLSLNNDVGTYAQGGAVNKPVDTYTPQMPAGTVQSVDMAKGGQMDAGDISGYSADGTPIVDNGDGTQSSGNINDLLGRPSNASVLGTGQTPVSGVSKNAANSLGNQQPKMAAGGEAPPPGSLSKEIADDVPAKLSQGEFVFSADVVRYYGLRLLNGMMEHARQELVGMENEGNIRSPGDNKNNAGTDKGTLAAFVQDEKPNMNAYDENGGNGGEQPMEDDLPTGILKECMGGGMATGGGVGEEDFAKGGAVDSSYGNDTGYGDNTTLMEHGGELKSKSVSPHPKGGTPLMDYAKGGIVTSASSSLSPKKFSSDVPSAKAKVSKPIGLEVPKIHSSPIGLPKMAQGGMAIKNMMPMPSV